MTQVTDQAQYQFIQNVTYNSATTIDDLPAGAVAVVDMGNTVITESVVDAVGSGSYNVTSPVRLVQKKADGTLLFSPFFTGADIVSKDAEAYTYGTNQVTYLGTNTTTHAVTGLGTHTAGDIYQVGVGLKNWGSSTTSLTYRDLAYSAVSGDTDKTVVAGLFDSAQRVLKRNAPYQAVSVERIADVASIAAFTGSAVLYKLTKDSTSVATYIKDADATSNFTASTATVAAGDVVAIASRNGRQFTFTADIAGSGAGRHAVYIGTTSVNVADAGTAANNATAIATAINASTTMGKLAFASASSTTVTVTYKNDYYGCPPMVMQTDDDSTWVNVAVTIAAGESKESVYYAAATTSAEATFSLDKPWQGETCYLYETTGTTTTASIGVATLSASKFGLKFSGMSSETFDPVNDSTLPVTFLIEPYRGATSTATNAFESTVNVDYFQGATSGTGNYKQVAQREIWDQFQNKGTNLQAYPRTKYKMEADADKVYSLVELRTKNQLNTILPGSNPATFMSIEVAIDRTLTTDIALYATVFGL